ncbi:MAG: hypothetical protein MI924_32695 [Chloroflexales bacterium]|nr:hypothetical protein [Chloroflexales bacterium]
MTPDELAQQLRRGLEMARDPQNAHVSSPNELRITTVYSPWLLQICAVCRHTFREGDQVLPDPRHLARMVHEDEPTALFCASRLAGVRRTAPPAAAPNQSIYAAFLQGLQTHWHPAGDVQTITAAAHAELIRRKCPICRHTVRAGDMVVLCPCGNKCGGVFHQDPMRHLTCWDTWKRGRALQYCAFTGAAFRSQGEEDA